MTRPKKPRFISFKPNIFYFKPRGVPLRVLEEVVLCSDELEAIKLSDVDNLDQTTCAIKVGVSQPTFARILSSAHKKLAEAVVGGKGLKEITTSN